MLSNSNHASRTPVAYPEVTNAVTANVLASPVLNVNGRMTQLKAWAAPAGSVDSCSAVSGVTVNLVTPAISPCRIRRTLCTAGSAAAVAAGHLIAYMPMAGSGWAVLVWDNTTVIRSGQVQTAAR